MPDIRQQSTIEALAQAFCGNGRKQEQAMIETGYSKAYASSYCGELWDNKRVISAIARIDAKQAEKAETTVESVHNLYQSAYDQAAGLNQPSAMVSAATGIARLYGMDKDAAVKDDKPESLTPEQVEEYRAMARAAIKLRLA